MRVCINHEVGIIRHFKSVCISLLKQVPDHWFHIILIARSVYVCYYLRIMFLSLFLLVKVFQCHQKVWIWINSRTTSKVLTAYQVVSQITWRVGYNIPFMQIAICFVPVCVYCSDFLLISYFPCTLYICQNLYPTSAFGLVNQKSIKLFD